MTTEIECWRHDTASKEKCKACDHESECWPSSAVVPSELSDGLYADLLDKERVGLELETIRETLNYYSGDQYKKDALSVCHVVDDLRHIAKALGI